MGVLIGSYVPNFVVPDAGNQNNNGNQIEVVEARFETAAYTSFKDPEHLLGKLIHENKDQVPFWLLRIFENPATINQIQTIANSLNQVLTETDQPTKSELVSSLRSQISKLAQRITPRNQSTNKKAVEVCIMILAHNIFGIQKNQSYPPGSFDTSLLLTTDNPGQIANAIIPNGNLFSTKHLREALQQLPLMLYQKYQCVQANNCPETPPGIVNATQAPIGEASTEWTLGEKALVAGGVIAVVALGLGIYALASDDDKPRGNDRLGPAPDGPRNVGDGRAAGRGN